MNQPLLLEHWYREAKALLRLGTPIFIGQLAIMGMGVTDTIMAGNYNATDLAAIAIGQSFWLPIVIFFAGFFNASTTLIAHQHGASNSTKTQQIFLQSILWLAFCSPLAILLLFNIDIIINVLKLEPKLNDICLQYLNFLLYGLPAALGFFVLRSLIEGIGATRIIMLIQLCAFICNIPLNYGFIFGRWGLPEMGGAGCGIATSIVLWLQCAIGLVLLCKHPILKALKLFHSPLLFNRVIFFKIGHLGLPIGLTFLTEVLLFSVIALIITPFGTSTIAGHQIALSVSTIVFMLPLSIGMAITIRMGQKLGAKQQDHANYSAKVGLSIMLITACLSMIGVLLFRQQLASTYSNNLTVINIASQLMLYTAIYQISDAVQICMTSALRSYQDTRIPLAIVLIAYWLISIPIGWSLSVGQFNTIPMEASGMWLGLVIGLSVAALLQGLRFRYVSRRALH